MRWGFWIPVNFVVCFLLYAMVTPVFANAGDEDLLEMDLANLMDVQITSAGRKSQALSNVPAAVYVIHREKLLDSGATSIAEALRLVPGLQVARINANRWAISSRGFNGTFSNKLLVQIDGRSVYTPSYSGVYWDLQHVLLEDVDRIEVIRGPGATLWGANAVNGIINIITLPASDTQGGLVSLGTGTHEKLMVSARVGTKLNTDTYARFYAMGNDRDSFVNATDGSDGNDGWKNGQAGFRIDADKGIRHSWTLQGDIFQMEGEQDVTPPTYSNNGSFVEDVKSHGGNILGRWTLKNSKENIWTVQAYYDFNTRDEPSLDQTHHTFDMDLQNRFQPARGHDVVWGMGYRMIRDDFSNTFQVQMVPDAETTHLFSGFAQDEITIIDDLLWLTLGSKIEHNDYTGLEIQPNVRILWRPEKRHSVWASVARAVRTPSRMEASGKIFQGFQSIQFPPWYIPAYLNGSPEYDAEKLIAWETGYRYAAGSDFSADISLFYNRYTDLGGIVEGEDLGTLYFANNVKGNTYGMEVAATWQPVEWMETEFTYSCLQMDITGDAYSKKIAEETSPSHQAGLRLGFNRLNLWARYTGKIKFLDFTNTDRYVHVIDDTVSLDANIQWRINGNIDFTVAGQNLLDGDFMEFGSDSYLTPIEIQRTLYAKITWQF